MIASGVREPHKSFAAVIAEKFNICLISLSLDKSRGTPLALRRLQYTSA
jgi:hypothetical protein